MEYNWKQRRERPNQISSVTEPVPFLQNIIINPLVIFIVKNKTGVRVAVVIQENIPKIQTLQSYKKITANYMLASMVDRKEMRKRYYDKYTCTPNLDPNRGGPRSLFLKISLAIFSEFL